MTAGAYERERPGLADRLAAPPAEWSDGVAHEPPLTGEAECRWCGEPLETDRALTELCPGPMGVAL